MLAAQARRWRPLSAYELRDLLRPDDAAITRASVYRSLDFLLEIGGIHRLETTKTFVAVLDESEPLGSPAHMRFVQQRIHGHEQVQVDAAG